MEVKLERIVFSESWQDFFSGFGLKSFDDFFYYPGRKKLSPTSNRDVHKLAFGQGPDKRTFFIKRFHSPHIDDIISSCRNFGRPMSQGSIEWKNIYFLLNNNIGTYQPVCFGERTICGIESKSFVITEKLKSTDFKEFISQKWLGLERNLQERIITEIAKFIRRMHNLNISMTDLYVWHIFIDENSIEKNCQLSIIDLHRMRRNVTSINEKIKNISRLFWSMSTKYFDDNITDLFIDSYIENGYESSKDKLVNKIQKNVDLMSRRRKKKEY